MPIKPKLPGLQGFQDWAQESPSVLDFPGEDIARKGARLFGLDADDAGITDMMNPMSTAAKMPLSALISIFKNKAAREASTKQFVESAANSGIPNLELAANTFASKYPRVAAHMRTATDKPLQQPKAWAEVDIPQMGVHRPLDIRFSARGVDRADNSAEHALNTMFHEGTHVAQGLGNRRASSLYKASNDVVGYRNNPFEVNARRAGEKAVGLPVNPPVPVPRQIEQNVVNAPQGMLDRLYGLMGRNTSSNVGRQMADKILEQRKSRLMIGPFDRE